MSEQQGNDLSTRAAVLFEKARKAAETGNFDQAIEAYIEGLRFTPDAVEEGHVPLREAALERQKKLGKKSTVYTVEPPGGKTPAERMLNAEYLLAVHPGHMPYAEAMLKAAVEGGFQKTAKWIADLMFLANKAAQKPSLGVYLLLTDCYKAIGHLERAVAACKYALKLKPDDKELAERYRDLSSRLEVTLDVEAEDELAKADEGSCSEETAEASEVPPEAGDEDIGYAKAMVFFRRAKDVAASGNFDYAINLYLEGLSCAPDAVEEGHIPLRELAMLRQTRGGKKPSVVEKVRRMRGKTPLERMLNAEFLLAKDPDHLPYAEALLKAAVEGGYVKTANWIADLLFLANNAMEKPSRRLFLLLKDSYAAVGLYDRAIAACQCAVKLKPEDGELADELKRLEAERTVARGHYDQAGDFTKSIKDREEQEKLHFQAAVVKTEDYRITAVADARKALAKDPDLPQNIFNLAQALADMETDQAESEAIELLEKAYAKKQDFTFKERAGQIRIKQLRRKIRSAKRYLESNPDDARAKARFAELTAELNNVELEHWRSCIENYPTDLRAKYEYGVRLLEAKKYDQAIPLLQEAQRDPRRKILAMNNIGLCFYHKGWFADAIDVFKRAIESYQIKDDGTAKELRYNLARAYEGQGDADKALELYRKIAQLDFAYKDVSKRVDRLRSSGTGPSSQ